MNQTLAPPTSAQSALYDLLARSWQLEAPVSSVVFDAAGKAAAFALGDGRLALAPLEEAESPMNRLRLELETGRTTIRPREKPVTPPQLTEVLADGAPLVVPSGVLGFVAACRTGRIVRVTPRAQVLPLTREEEPLGAIATDGRGRLAVARDGQVVVHDEEGMARRVSLLTAGMAGGLDFAPDGATLAVMLSQSLILWQPGQASERYAVGGSVLAGHSPDGAWIAGSDAEVGLWLVRLADGRIARIGNFRTQPVSIGFGAGTAFASGAFRLAGWSLDAPPFENEATGALRSGRSGLVLIERVAPHPTRPLVASGMADGAVMIASPGMADEMPLRHADGAAITALGWSRCGTHLAIGTARGDAALVTLPPQLFK